MSVPFTCQPTHQQANAKTRKRTCCRVSSNKTAPEVADIVGYSCLACLERALKSEERNANSVDGNGHLPLVVASSAGDVAVVKLLLDHGADPSKPDKCGVDAFRAVSSMCYLSSAVCMILYRHALTLPSPAMVIHTSPQILHVLLVLPFAFPHS